MIPPKIHFTWFSSDPYPENIRNCMESWRNFMPNYEFIHWDFKKISDIPSPFLKEAILAKKWAFASDYVRLWALYTEGGIYLDTDVLCYKSLDPLRSEKIFIGKENSIHISGRLTEQYLTSHCMGAEAGSEFFRLCLDYYKDRRFINSENVKLPPTLRLDMTLLPYIQSEIAKTYGYNPYPSAKGVQRLEDGLTIYPPQYFDAVDNDNNSYCKHLALGAWREYRVRDEEINLSYKIRWRIRKLVENVLERNGYIMTKKL